MVYDLERTKYFLKFCISRVRQKGFFHCSKVAFFFGMRLITFYPLGFLASPFCRAFKIRFLDVLTCRIGHLCAEPDCYVKEEILGGHPKYKAVILAPGKKVSNSHLLSYWEKFFRIIRSPCACLLLRPLAENPCTVFSVRRYCGRISVHQPSGMNKNVDYARIENSYYASGGRPLLALTQSDHERGWDVLERLGVPRTAWFVSVHCREAGYKGYQSGEDQAFRNAEIDNFVPALESLVERGAWVIRMGDPSMKPIPARRNIIDYAHLDVKSDWMDVFLSARCRFFIGSASGLCELACIFGVPLVTANNAPMTMVFSYRPYDIAIPKLLRRKGQGKYLGFKEVLGSSIGDYRLDSYYADAGIETVQNSPEDIRDLAMEMTDRLENKARYTADDEIRQERFKSLLSPDNYSYTIASRVGRDFLRKYEYLL